MARDEPPAWAIATPALMRDLRSLRVLVVHPNDQDGDSILQQLRRIGCQAMVAWPPAAVLPAEVDLVIVAVRPETIGLPLPWATAAEGPPIIAVVNYENPVIVEAVLRMRTAGLLTSPVRSFGLLTVLVLARKIATEREAAEKKLKRLEAKLAGIDTIRRAKEIIAAAHGIAEREAYQVIRKQATIKRITVEEIAAAIINANDVLTAMLPVRDVAQLGPVRPAAVVVPGDMRRARP